MRKQKSTIVPPCCYGLMLAAALGLAPGAAAQCIDMVKLLASDGAAGDNFALIISISGDVVVVGAPQDDDSGSDSGSAYVYRFNGTTWVEEQKLVASDSAAGDFFGIRVSVNGDVAVVSAIGDDDKGDDSGSAYIFRHNGSMWVEEQKLTATDGAAFDNFGSSVSVSGDVAVVSAYRDEDNGNDSGSAYIFRFNGSMWVEEQKLTATDGAASDIFGSSVSVSGDVVVVVAPQDDDSGSDSGSAYVYRFNGATWVEEQKLTASDGAAFDNFGSSVSVSGDVAVVSAYQDDDNGGNAGSAYIFRYNGAMWVEEQKLLASDGAADDQFGISVSVSGDLAVVGAFLDDDRGASSGSAYVYRFDGIAWVEEQKLTATDGEANDGFGYSVSVSGDVAVIGAIGDDAGSAYIPDLRLNRLNADCNGNGIADVVDLLDGAAADCNDNLIPDSCDIAGGFSLDANVNGIPDECEISACPGDITGDGLTNVTDLLALLAAWGACP